MMKKLTLFLTLIVLTSTVSEAQNFTVVYDFDSVKTNSGLVDPTAVPTALNVTFGSFSAAGTPLNPNATSRFSFTDWPTGALNTNDMYSSLTGSTDTSQYYEVTLTPDNGYSLDLSAVTFSVQRSGTGIRTYSVRSSVDSFSANLSASVNPANTNLSVQAGNVFFLNFDAVTSNQNGSTITLGGSDYTAITMPVTFRFYAWNSEATSGTFSIDNVTITGEVNGIVTASYTAGDVCEGDSIHFMDMSLSTNANIIEWAWDFGDGSPMDSVQNPAHYFSAPGMYVVELTVTDDSLNTDTYTDSVYVHPKPVAGWAVPTTGTICAGTDVSFADASTISSGSIAGYDWSFGDPASGTNDTSSLETPSHLYTTAAGYLVTQIVTSDQGCMDTAAANLTIAADVTAAFSFSASGTAVTFTDLTVGATTWSWSFGDSTATDDYSSLQNPSYTYPADVQATACLTVTNAAGCMDVLCQEVITVGIHDTPLEALTAIYPSPSADGIFTIRLGDFKSETIATVYNVIGKVVYTKELAAEKDTIDLSNQVNGSYFVVIKNNAGVITKKIVINK